MMRDYLQPTSAGATLGERSIVYRSSTPRAALALTAATLAAITFSAMVVLPATLDGVHAGPSTLMAATTATRTVSGVAASSACVAVPPAVRDEADSGQGTIEAQQSLRKSHFSRSRAQTRI